MRVKDLMAALSTLDGDLPVAIYCDNREVADIPTRVTLMEVGVETPGCHGYIGLLSCEGKDGEKVTRPHVLIQSNWQDSRSLN